MQGGEIFWWYVFYQDRSEVFGAHMPAVVSRIGVFSVNNDVSRCVLQVLGVVMLRGSAWRRL